MKISKLYLVLILICLISTIRCYSSNGLKDSLGVAAMFIEAVRTSDYHQLDMLKLDADAVRIIAPDAVEGLSDEEISKKFNNDKKNSNDFNEILKSAEKHKLALNKIIINNIKIERLFEGENKPIAMTINYIYDNMNGDFALSVIQINDKWYLLEILTGLNAFDKMTKKVNNE